MARAADAAEPAPPRDALNSYMAALSRLRELRTSVAALVAEGQFAQASAKRASGPPETLSATWLGRHETLGRMLATLAVQPWQHEPSGPRAELFLGLGAPALALGDFERLRQRGMCAGDHFAERLTANYIEALVAAGNLERAKRHILATLGPRREAESEWLARVRSLKP